MSEEMSLELSKKELCNKTPISLEQSWGVD